MVVVAVQVSSLVVVVVSLVVLQRDGARDETLCGRIVVVVERMRGGGGSGIEGVGVGERPVGW